MKKLLLILLLFVFAAGITKGQVSQSVVHLTTSGNITSNFSKIIDSKVPANPDAALLLTHNATPAPGVPNYHDLKMGLWYYAGNWILFNQNTSVKLDSGKAFNVFVPGVDTKSWIHTADSVINKIINNYTVIDHKLINGDSTAIIFISDVYNAGGNPGVYNKNVMGVFYNGVLGKWCIFNQDANIKMIKNSSYSVVIPESFSTIARYVHRSVKSNVSGPSTILDHPDANNNPNARIFVTQNWNPNKAKGKYNNKNIGVFYIGGKWTIYNENMTDMDTGVSFNVMVLPDKSTSILNMQEMKSEIHMFPNPVQNGDNLEILINNNMLGNIDIELVDMTGKVMITKQALKDRSEWKVSLLINGMARGVYILRVGGGGFNSVQRVVIE